MNVREITGEELSKLLEREESHFFDFKGRDVAPRQIEKVAVAFANADGGELIIGVSEDIKHDCKVHKVQGFSDLEAMNSVLQRVFSLNPPVGVAFEFLKCQEFPGYLLWLRVEKGANVHKTSDAAVYVRQGAQSLPLKDPERIAALGFAKGAQSFEDSTLPELKPEVIVDSDRLAEFLENVSPRTDPLEFCLNQNLIESKEWHPRVAAALLFSENPSAFIPRKCAVKITRYKTAEDDPERDHLSVSHAFASSGRITASWRSVRCSRSGAAGMVSTAKLSGQLPLASRHTPAKQNQSLSFSRPRTAATDSR